jgi:hypothetical protein
LCAEKFWILSEQNWATAFLLVVEYARDDLTFRAAARTLLRLRKRALEEYGG